MPAVLVSPADTLITALHVALVLVSIGGLTRAPELLLEVTPLAVKLHVIGSDEHPTTGLHDVDERYGTVPAGHCSHFVPPVTSSNWPAAHVAQVVRPPVALILPIAHKVHPVWPVLDWCLPTEQAAQAKALAAA